MTETLPANFRRIRLELAREPGHPQGDSHTGYVLIAPLDEHDFLDAETAKTHRAACVVTRFKDGEMEERGVLTRRRGGAWAFHYVEEDGDEDDDVGFRLGGHAFRVGEYVTIQEDEGAHTYRVTSVQSL